VTADRSQSLAQTPPADPRTKDLFPGWPTQLAATVTRWGLPAFILTLPLEFTSQYLKLQLARIVLVVVGLAFAYLVVTGERKLVVPLSSSSIVLVAFVGVSVLSWLLTRAPGSKNELADVVLYPFVALLVVNLARTETDHRNAWIAFLVSGIVIALLLAVLHFTHLAIWRGDPLGARTNATFGDPNVAARFLTLSACAGIVLFAGRVRVDKLALGAVATGAAFTASTLSKSSLLVFPISAAVAAVFGRDRRRAAAVGALALVIFAASVVFTPGASPRIVRAINQVLGGANIIATQTSTTTTNQQINQSELDLVRVYLIRAGWQMFLDHPIAGVGLGGYQHALTTTYKSYLPQNPPATLSHTAFVTVLAEQGLIGIGLLGGFLVLLVWEVIRSLRRPTSWREWIVTPAILFIPIIAFSQVEGRMLEEPYLWLALGLLYSARSLEKSMRTVELPA